MVVFWSSSSSHLERPIELRSGPTASGPNGFLLLVCQASLQRILPFKLDILMEDQPSPTPEERRDRCLDLLADATRPKDSSVVATAVFSRNANEISAD